jgi:hypothetical protein
MSARRSLLVVMAVAVVSLSAPGVVWSEVTGAVPAPEPTALGEEWAPLSFLLGEWEGGGGGAPGASEGQFSFRPDLQGRVMVRRNDTVTPAGLHQDLLVLYPTMEGAFRAIYFDSEGHVINYGVSTTSSPPGAVFLSDESAGMPRFRLSYRLNADGTLYIGFEMAPPGSGEFSMYLEGVGRRFRG